ncbi:MAG TPA: hypothetical protein VFZ96_00030 [Actinomycetota bacterium]|nr:hypothetical protein [Actinomycetota bacterium]
MNGTGYVIVAYVGAGLLYGLYLLWLLAQERRLGGRGRDAAR